MKRGFTYLTGTSQTSLTLTLRNNAPGGGGNDWALDDISFATCLPNMRYSPTLNPMVCDSNTITIRDTVRSYFNNYNNYKWQRSTDAGSTWSDIAGTTGTGTPVLIGSEYEYVASYTVPPTQTYAANNGDKYRLIVATTPSNLTSTDCQVTDGVSIVTLQVIDCMGVLSTNLLSFNGQLIGDEAHIYWTMSKEDEPLTFDLEKSFDGINFILAGTVHSKENYNSEINYYSFVDPQSSSQKTWYRLIIKNSKSNTKTSKTILLQTATDDIEVVKVVNPFNNELVFYIVGTKTSNITAEIIDMFGKTVSKTNYLVNTGLNKFSINNTNNISRGIYTLRVILSLIHI